MSGWAGSWRAHEHGDLVRRTAFPYGAPGAGEHLHRRRYGVRLPGCRFPARGHPAVDDRRPRQLSAAGGAVLRARRHDDECRRHHRAHLRLCTRAVGFDKWRPGSGQCRRQHDLRGHVRRRTRRPRRARRGGDARHCARTATRSISRPPSPWRPAPSARSFRPASSSSSTVSPPTPPSAACSWAAFSRVS